MLRVIFNYSRQQRSTKWAGQSKGISDYTFADDITEEEALQYIEKVDKPAEWSQTTDLGSLGELTSIQAGRTVAGGARLLGDALSPIIGDNVLSQEARGFEKYAKERSQELAVPNQSIWQPGVESGLTSVPQVLPWVVGGSVIGATRGAAALAKGIPEAIAKSFAAGAGIKRIRVFYRASRLKMLLLP